MAGPPGKPVTQAERDRIAELHARGLKRNEIAREIGRSRGLVSRVCADLGLTFDRTMVAAATEARKVDARARRAQLALDLLDDVTELRARLHAPYTVWRIGNDGDLMTGTLARPDARDQRDLMMAVGTAIDRSLKLDQYDADPGINGAKSMLAALAAGLGAAYEQLQPTVPDDGD